MNVLPRVLAALAVAVVAASCDAVTPSPSATPFVPTAPLMRYPGGGGYSFDGTTWTFHGSVNPNGSPTDVVLEVGSGTSEAPTFDRELPVAEGLILPEAFEFQTSELEAPFCVRFTATNEVGSTSTAALWRPASRSRPIPRSGRPRRPADAPSLR